MMNNRHPLDFYESPWWFATELARHQTLSGTVFEPCAGHGAIAKILVRHPRITAIATNDIDPHKHADFHLDATNPKSWESFPESDWIITNPPYGDKAAAIVQLAYQKAKRGIAMFLLLSFLEPCDDRAAFLEAHPPSKILVFPRYCFRKDKAGKRWATDNVTICCFIWDKAAQAQAPVVLPAAKIPGFYKNPDKAIAIDKAIEYLFAGCR